MKSYKSHLEESAAAVKKMKDMEDKRRRDQQAAKKRAEDDTPSKPKAKSAPSKPETSAERKARRHQQDQSDFSKVAARHREEASKHEQKAKDHSEKTKGVKGKLFGGKHKEAAKLHTAAAAAHHAAASVADKVHKDAGGKKTSYSNQKDYHKHSNAATDAGYAAHRHNLQMRESFDEAIESYITEKLKASDKMGDWVKDFQDSDAPQFKGKSKEKKRQMAVAAKLGAEREAGMREETDLEEAMELDEASVTPGDLKAQAEGKKAARKGQKYNENPYEKGSSRHLQWSKGHNAARAGMKEEVEQIDEISKDLARSYKYKAQMSEPEDMRQYKNRSKGIERADKKLKKEEFELDEQAQYDLIAAYLLENNIDVDTLSEEELNEIIGKVIGGAFKVGAKAAVGAAKVAGKVAKSVVKNKQGNVRGSMAAKNDATRAKLDKLKQQRTAEVKKRLEARKNKQLQTAVQKAKDKLAASKARAASGK